MLRKVSDFELWLLPRLVRFWYWARVVVSSRRDSECWGPVRGPGNADRVCTTLLEIGSIVVGKQGRHTDGKRDETAVQSGGAGCYNGWLVVGYG